MDKSLRTKLDNLRSKDREAQNKAFLDVLRVTDKRVEWAYDVWDEILGMLTSKDNHERAIAAQVLCNLAKSDPKARMLRDLPALIRVTKDERFVTARHCMQALWKVGVLGKRQQALLMKALEQRFRECVNEKNCTLIRYDILQSMRNVYDNAGDETIRKEALALIELEEDAKYRKKYGTLWKDNQTP